MTENNQLIVFLIDVARKIYFCLQCFICVMILFLKMPKIWMKCCHDKSICLGDLSTGNNMYDSTYWDIDTNLFKFAYMADFAPPLSCTPIFVFVQVAFFTPHVRMGVIV